MEDGAVTLDVAKRESWIEVIEKVNQWLREEYWPEKAEEEGGIKDGGEWIVGEEQGLDFHKGRLWYGGGERVMIGEGF